MSFLSGLLETSVFQLAALSTDDTQGNVPYAEKPQTPTVSPGISGNGVYQPAEDQTIKGSTDTNNEAMALYNLGIALSASLDIDHILQTLHRESGSLVDTSNFAVLLGDGQSRTLDVRFAVEQRRLKSGFQTKRSEQGLVRHILTTQAPLLISGLSETQNVIETAPLHADKPIRSWLGVPIYNPAQPDAKMFGCIVIWSYAPNSLTDHDLWLLTAIGTQAAMALRNAHLSQANRQQEALTDALHDISRLLTSLIPVDEILDRLMTHIKQLLNIETGWLLLADVATGDLILRRAVKHTSQEQEPESLRIPRGQGVPGRVVETGRPVMLKDVDAKTRNVLGIPLVLNNQVIGVLVVMNKKVGDFDGADLKLLTALAAHITLTLENAQLHEAIFTEQDRLLDLEEQVRQEVARDLHDGPVQKVSSMMMRANFCETALDKDPTLVADEIAQIKDFGEEAIHQMRTLLVELRPLELEQHGQGLAAALRVFLERRQREARTTRLNLICQPNKDISRQEPQIEKAIFTIVQEAVNNALKHAQARQINVEITETATTIEAIIIDNGRGFDVEQVTNDYTKQASMGMLNIRERAEAAGGTLELKSTPGRGTRIGLSIPKAKADRLRNRTTTGRLRLPGKMRQGE